MRTLQHAFILTIAQLCLASRYLKQDFDSTTLEGEIEDTRRKDDTWLVGYLDKPKSLRPQEVPKWGQGRSYFSDVSNLRQANEKAKKRLFDLHDGLFVEISNHLVPFSALPRANSKT